MRHNKGVTGISFMVTSVLGIVALGCEPKLDFTHDGLPVFATSERKQLHRSDSLALPFRTAVVGDYPIVLDRASDPAVHVLNRFDGSLLQSYGRKGAGPGEFEMPWSIDPDPTADGIWVYDVQHRRMTHIDLRQLDAGKLVFFTTHIMEVAERMADRLAIIHQGRLVADGTLAELREKLGRSAREPLEDLFLRITDKTVDDAVSHHPARPGAK